MSLRDIFTWVAVVGMISFVQASHAEMPKGLEPYLTDDVVAVAYLDLTKVDTLSLLELGTELGAVSKEDRGEASQTMLALQQQIDELVDSGAEKVFALFRLADLGYGGPTWVIPVAKPGNANQLLQKIIGDNKYGTVALVPRLNAHWQVHQEAVIGGASKSQLESLEKAAGKSSRDTSQAWQALGQGDCGLVLLGDKNSRRVISEMLPALPGPLAVVNGPMIADGLEWAGATIKLPPQLNVKILIQGTNSNVAEALEQAIVGGLAMLKSLPQVQEVLGENGAEALVTSLTPSLESTRLTIDMKSATEDAERLEMLIGPAIREARAEAMRSSRMNQFKQLGLAFHNYADKNKRFPAAASYSDDGKPLLSWRVHLLPHLDQYALYQQFHLDEPWDSEHNRQLIQEMPQIYFDPDPALRKINSQGKTTYAVPVGEGTIFDRKVGTVFKEIMDGTSNTILSIEVPPEGAVVWTKPADWEVDFADPLKGILREDRDKIVAGFCDGHVRTFSLEELEDWKMSAWLTRAGEEVVE